MRGRSKPRQPSNEPSAQEPVSLQLIADKLERLIWRKRLWGVDERQVWHVVSRLDEMYRQLYREQQVRYEALLAQARGMPVSPPESPVPRQATQQAPRQPQTQTQPSAFQPVPRYRNGSPGRFRSSRCARCRSSRTPTCRGRRARDSPARRITSRSRRNGGVVF